MPYASPAQRGYLHAHPEITDKKGHPVAAKWDAEIRRKKRVKKNRGEGWLKPVLAGTLAGGLANQFPRVQDVEREARRKRQAASKKGKVHKAYTQHVYSDDPEFNHVAAQKTFDLVMKMDDDTAVMFTLIAMSEIFENDITKNLRTLQGHLNEVISKRLEVIGRAVDRSIAKGATDDGYGRALTEITKAVVNPYISGLYDFKESDFRRDPHSGQFRAKVTSTQKKPFENKVADGMGLRPEKGADRNRYSHLSSKEKAAYQDQYRQLSSFLNVVAQSGTGDNRVMTRWQDKSGNEFRRAHNGGADGANDLLLRRGTDLVGIEANPEGLTAGGAGFALAQAMGAQPGPRTGGFLEGVNRADVGLASFNQEWLKTGDTEARATNDRLYARTGLAGQYLGQVAPDNSKVAAAAKLAEVVGSHGAEAEAVIGPTARKTAYRYRGTEKTPDADIVSAYNTAISNAKRTGAGIPLVDEQELRQRTTGKPTAEEAGIGASRKATRVHAVGGPDTGLAPSQMGMARAAAEARPPTWAERGAGRIALQEQLKTDARMPKKKLYELQTKAGNTPPSEGVILNAQGQIATQAVGYGDDHYLPFNLKNLKALKGGEYVRTRSVGGLTSEDIYTGLMTGARRVTVVSRSGTFSMEFEPDFRGGRRYNDKALRMTRRYESLLDAVQSNQVSRGNVPQVVQDAIRAEVIEDYPYEKSRAALNSKYQQRLKEYREDPELGPHDERMLRFIASDVAQKNPSRSEVEWMNAAKNKVMEGKLINYQLDGKGYEAAQDALAEQFPYYVKSYPITEEEPEGISYEKDKGYVEPGRVLATALSGGLYGTAENAGAGQNVGDRKFSQSQANYQRGRMGPGQRDITPGQRDPGAVPANPGAVPLATPAALPAENPEAGTTPAETPETPDGGAPVVGFGVPAPVTPAPAAPAPAAPAAFTRPARAVTRGTPAAATPAAGTAPDTPGASETPDRETASAARRNAVRADIDHEDAAYDLFTQMKRKLSPTSRERRIYDDVLSLDDEHFLQAWQANGDGFRDRFNELATSLETTGAAGHDPKALAYRRAHNAAVSPVVAGEGLVQHWSQSPQAFIGVGYQATSTDDQRAAEAQRLDQRTRPVTATSALSELASDPKALEREHAVLRKIHTELRLNPKLSEPGEIDARNEAIERAFDGAPPTMEAGSLLANAKPKDLIARMGDVQRMRTLRANYKGAWPLTGAQQLPPGREIQRDPSGRPRLRLVGESEVALTPQSQALEHQVNKAKVMQRLRGLRRYRSHLPIGSDVETPGDESLTAAEVMLARYTPGRTPPSTPEVEAFLDATDADYKTNPGANDELKPGEVQLQLLDPDAFLSQFTLNDEGRWVHQESTG